MLFVGLHGYDGHGKSTASADLAEALPAWRVEIDEMSDPLFAIADILGLDVEAKAPLQRRALAAICEFGTTWTETLAPASGPWVLERLLRQYPPAPDRPDLVLIPGVRRREEADWIHARGGRMIHIRPDMGSTITPSWWKPGTDFRINSPLSPGEEMVYAGEVRGVAAALHRILQETTA